MNYKKIYCQLLATAESNYYRVRFDSKLNTVKSLWREIYNLCCKDSKASRNKLSIPKLVINENIETDSKLIANEFNKYFCNVGADLAKNLLPSNHNLDFKYFLPPSRINSFMCDSISHSEILNIIINLKSKKAVTLILYMLTLSLNFMIILSNHYISFLIYQLLPEFFHHY